MKLPEFLGELIDDVPLDTILRYAAAQWALESMRAEKASETMRAVTKEASTSRPAKEESSCESK